MKGIAHFAAGVAAASFIPELVGAAASNAAFGPLLGGLAGLLPDTLDFKLLRFLEQRDVEIDPLRLADGEGEPDPQALADTLAAAVARAAAERRTLRIHLHTARLGGDLWRRWTVGFAPGEATVTVRVGPVVTTGQVPLPGSEPRAASTGQARLTVPILYDYDPELPIDILGGPSLTLAPCGGAVEITFLPWHRAWSHSLLVVLLLGAAGWLLAPACGLAMALAALAHVALDQLGSMGSNLWFPLARRRSRGLRLVRSGDALPNLLTVWLSVALILFNLDRFSASPVLPVIPYLLLTVALPCLACAGFVLARSKRQQPLGG